MSGSQVAHMIMVDNRDDWEALTLCPGSKRGEWFPEQTFGFVDFYSTMLAGEALVGLGL